MFASVRTPAPRSKPRRSKRYLVQKPHGQLTTRVQQVGPERFGIVSVDCGKAASKYMVADFYGRVLIAPTKLAHNRGDLDTALGQIAGCIREHALRDLVVAIERTGEYHRIVQRAVRQRGWEARLVHPFTSKQFRLPADPNNKTDDTDLGGIHRAAVNGFGLLEPAQPPEYQRLQILVRHRRDLVRKASRLSNQIKEVLHAAMPGYTDCFSNLWACPMALVIARQTGSATAIRQLGLAGLQRLVTQAGRRCRTQVLIKIQAWAEQAPEGHSHSDCLQRILAQLDDDRQRKLQEIAALERDCATLVTGLPYILLLVIPGINLITVADLAAELGPMGNYATANQITGRAGLAPSRYQSEAVDHADGPLRRTGNRRIRGVLMQTADNLIRCNHYFAARAQLWASAGKSDARWLRVKVSKCFSRIALAMVGGRQLFPHPCCQPRHAILDKLLTFHREHGTPMDQVMRDLDEATKQLPRSAYAHEAEPLQARLQKLEQSRSKRPQPLSSILPIVLARLGIATLQSEPREDRDPS
jgi:transposase